MTRRRIEKRIEALEGPTGYGDLPMLTLAELIAADEIETVDEGAGVYRIDGRLMQDTSVGDP